MINLSDTIAKIEDKLIRGQDALTAKPDPGKRNAIGLHINHDALRIVELIHGQVVRWKLVPYPDGLLTESETFPEFLKESLQGFSRDLPVWVVSSFTSLQLRYLSLPKVRPGQVSNLVYWTYRKELPFDAEQTIFDYDLEGETALPGQPRKIEATAYTVSRAEIDKVVQQIEAGGCEVEGVVIPSFALRNLLRMQTSTTDELRMALYVGEDASSILFAKGGTIVAQRLFKTGMITLRSDTTGSSGSATAYQTINLALSQTAHGDRTIAAMEATEADRITRRVLGSFGRLVQQIERSISAYLSGHDSDNLKAIYVVGTLAGMPILVKELGTRLGLKSLPLYLPPGDPLISRAQPQMSPEDMGQISLAIGAAISDPTQMPNIRQTYVKREHNKRRERAQSWAGIFAIAGILLMVLLFASLLNINRGLRRELRSYQQKIEPYKPFPNRQMIQDLSAQTTINVDEMRHMSDRIQPLALINELAGLTPEDVRLTSILLERVAVQATKGKAPGSELRVHVEGMILGEAALLESKLASYIVHIERSPLYERAAVSRSESGRDGSEQVWLFTLDLEASSLAPPPVLAAPAAGGTKP